MTTPEPNARTTASHHAPADDRAAHGTASHHTPADDHATHGTASHHTPADDHAAAGRTLRGGDHAGQPGGGPRSLADRQAELVAALTSGQPVPVGFDLFKVDAARVALLRKRAGEVARQWPMLAAAFGDGWKKEFADWAAARPTQGSLRDGWDLARDLHTRGALPATAGEELAEREVRWTYDGVSAPRPRRGPAMRSAAGAVVMQIAGRVHVLRRAPN
jgi:hypothetical protein